MSWTSWFKKTDTQNTGKPKVKKLPKPKDLDQRVGRYLVVDMDQDPDWVWRLKNVLRPMPGNKSRVEFRVFKPERARLRGIDVKNFNTLDEHPELILFEGWFDKTSNRVRLEDRRTPKNRSRVA